MFPRWLRCQLCFQNLIIEWVLIGFSNVHISNHFYSDLRLLADLNP